MELLTYILVISNFRAAMEANVLFARYVFLFIYYLLYCNGIEML